MLALNYGHWYFWEDYPQNVTFDGINKLVLINYGITQIDAKVDIYSNWKEWALLGDNAKFEPALSAEGGQPTVEGRSLGSTFFIENGWKMRTWEGDHRLTVVGNIFTTDNSNAFVPTIGNHNIQIVQNVSNIIDVVEVGGDTLPPNGGSSGLTPTQEERLYDTLTLKQFVALQGGTIKKKLV